MRVLEVIYNLRLSPKIQILKLKSTIQNWIVLFLFFASGNKVKSQIFIQDSSTFYVAKNTNVILEKRVSPKLTTSKIYIVKGTTTNIHTDSNSEIVYLETTGDGQKVIIPKASSKKKLIAQSEKKIIRHAKEELNTFCNRFVSLLLLNQKIFISSNISRKDNDKRQGIVRYLVQLDLSIRASEKRTYYPTAIHYWNCKKETKKVRPPPLQA